MTAPCDACGKLGTLTRTRDWLGGVDDLCSDCLHSGAEDQDHQPEGQPEDQPEDQPEGAPMMTVTVGPFPFADSDAAQFERVARRLRGRGLL